jgi:hypothetical protein
MERVNATYLNFVKLFGTDIVQDLCLTLSFITPLILTYYYLSKFKLHLRNYYGNNNCNCKHSAICRIMKVPSTRHLTILSYFIKFNLKFQSKRVILMNVMRICAYKSSGVKYIYRVSQNWLPRENRHVPTTKKTLN